ncbi:MAG: ferritin-like domain-containing protein [Acetobacteraceae bacterium]|nr:ferritin-like domain-containing protein [Acetobacteraceae bacterium]
MLDIGTDEDSATPGGLDRRQALKRLSAGVAGAAALGGLAAGGLGLSSQPAVAASGLTDVQILNFALNLEYLEAEYYLRAVSGQGLSPSLTTGVGAQGTVTGGTLVPFSTNQGAFTAIRIAIDELSHVEFLRGALGAAAVAEPTIDLQTSFTTLAVSAGLIQSGQTFNPFASELDFLIGAYIFEDVGVTAYAGAAAAISSPANLSYAASILAIEAYHAGAIRSVLAQQGQGNTTNAISALRAKLSGVGDNGTNAYGNPFNVSNGDATGLAFRRTPAQVLSIVYGGGTASGLFFPNGINAGT